MPVAPAAAEPPIDAVITWVDGSDPAHLAKRLEFQGFREPGRDRKSTRPTRFEQAGELEWCVRLIRKFASWIRTIFIVTDAQRPSFLTDDALAALGARIVDHKELFSGHTDFLPTFNSLSIETMLWRVPGLADRFVYFNDDVFLVNATEPSDFFVDAASRVRGDWVSPVSTGARLMREMRRTAARHFTAATFRDGLNGRWAETALLPEFSMRWFALAHAAFPMSRPLLRRVVEGEDRFENARYRFRNAAQFSPVALAVHRGLAEGTVTPGPADWEYLECTKHSARVVAHRIARCEAGGSVKMLCAQSLEAASPLVRGLVMNFLDRVAA